jgi:DNA adenine methylase|tara:strand:+ start:432 stop:1457 length:1026 start_codon:yes stop_codon:yes gene_type:complete
MKPLFMWAGGKNKMLAKYEDHLPDSFTSYIEPFFGGGAMFIWAYQQNPDADFFINDINPHIMGIYESVKDNPRDFCKYMDGLQKDFLSLDPPTRRTKERIDGKDKVKWIPHPTGAPDKDLEKSYKLKGNTFDWVKIYKDKPTRRSFFFKTRQLYQENQSGWSRVEKDAVLYFLMKTAFNGVWQVSKKSGAFNTPCGLMRQTDRVYDKENVMKWHQALQKCTIMSGDFSNTLSKIGPNSFTFLDPPYRSGTADSDKTFANYDTKMDDDFQETVLDFFAKARYNRSYTLLSNRDWGDGFFEKRSGQNKIVYFDVTYTVGRKKKDKESGKHAATKAREILIIGK